MMFSHFMHAASLVLAFAVSASRAKPVYLGNRDAVSPPITNPTAQTVWKTGEVQTVTWDVSALNGAPPSNPLASILLGTLTSDGNEHLMVDSPLVTNVPIIGGNATLTVPTVPSGKNYIVCLFGSSGDISPLFTIVGTDSSSSAAPSVPVPSSVPSSVAATPSTQPLPATSQAGPSTTDGPASPSAVPTSSAPSAVSNASASATAPATPSPSASVSQSGSGLSAGGDAAATSLSSASPSPSAAPGTSGAQRGAIVPVHLWGALCALLFAQVLL
ncbi:hypothetical protein C2E23DRAFT_924333 [Lenzites betulinus]|nr:hypothetical protein C2E23DRAFT_924333 [Lenzites betulinus]